MAALQAARRLARLASYTLLALVVALSLARYLDAPLALVLVAGRSMEPSIHLGDLVLLERVDDPRSLKPGDVVLWCLGRGCVLHRVQGFQDGRIITKGDANPYPDPPVPLEAVRYRMLLRIPREAYLAPLAVHLTLEALHAARRRRAARTRRIALQELEKLAAVALALYAASMLVASIAAPPPAQRSDLLEGLRPTILLTRTSLAASGAIEAIFTLENVPSFEPTETCVIYIDNVAQPCKTLVLYNNGSTTLLLVRPQEPEKLYTKAYMENLNSLSAEAEIDVGVGMYKMHLTYTVYWSPPRIAFNRTSCTVILRNENRAPARIPVNLTIRYYDLKEKPTRHIVLNKTEKISLALEPGERSIRLEPHDWIIVVAEYPQPGGHTVRKEVANTWCRSMRQG